MTAKKLEIATIGGGCFWCIEAVFQEIKGVREIVSGYSGGNAPGKPTYREVCSGLTGHAEVVQLRFDSELISYSDILTVFMTSHDPTTLNRQGGDTGSQYRSVIYFHNEDQREVAEMVVKEVAAYYENPIVTQISFLGVFYAAKEHHQNYYANNTSQGYCSAVITPKLAKLRKTHADKLKEKFKSSL